MTGTGPRGLRVLLVVALATTAALLTAAPVAAHPLGLPAFAQVVASADDEVTVTWNAAPDDVAALARGLGLDVDGDVLTREQDARLAASGRLRTAVAQQVEVRQDGARCSPELVPVTSVVSAGLTVVARCPRAVDEVEVRIALLHDVDERYRTLVAAAGPQGVERVMLTAAAPAQEVRLDPAAAGLLPAPAAASERAGGTDLRGAFGGVLPLERRFVTALDEADGPGAALLALLVALGVGAAHALAPGHGKAVAAAYLVGDRGRVRDAALLGGVVALMHTGSVLVLGLALYSATRRPDAGRLTDTLQLVTGLLFAGLGAFLLVRRRREGAPAHDHGHGPGHEHAPRRAPLSREGVVALGAAGGLLPSPSALLVLLTALAAGRLAFGLSLIAAFSIGLAATLTLAGVAVLRGRDVLHTRAHERVAGRLHRAMHAAPLLGAGVVTALGLVLAARALARLL